MEDRRIPLAEPCLGEKELEYVIDCIKSRWISSIGDYVTQFERKFSRYCGSKYGITTSNGTTALHLALVTLGISKGDEVIVPDMTFIATANAVKYCNATPVFVDSEKETWNIAPEKVEEKVTPNTKAIIPVHLYGHPCDMDAILDIAEDHNLHVVEDAAEAHGAEYRGKKTGGLADMGCFSFYGNKIITTGEGGMITTNNENVAEKARMFRDHAMSVKRKYWHQYVGYNYRLTNLQAAVGLAQLEKIDRLIEKKRKIAKLYNSKFEDVKSIKTPPEATWAKNVYWMYSVLIENGFGTSRDTVIKKLAEKGIETRPFFYPLHVQPPYASMKQGDFPVSEELSKKGINLPSFTDISEEEIAYVVELFLSLKK